MMVLALAACGPEPAARLTERELRNPAVCAECHPDHYREWSGSMHAYATDDPVFRAMNAQGQRETGGELGDFCVRCHAPAAVELGYAADGAVDDVPAELRGVGCWYCHRVTDVEGAHNNPLDVAESGALFGPIRDPVDTAPHRSAYSPLLDRDELRSADLCGPCHDIVSPLGAHIERTYAEWQESLFAAPATALACSGCHLPGRDDVAATGDGMPVRRVHDHSLAAVDVALTPFPEAEAQRAAVQELLDDTISAYLCASAPVSGSTLAVVTLENVAAGHAFPSGATADRRVWVELTAWSGDEVVWSTGRPPEDGAIGLVTDGEDPDLWRLWSTLLDAYGQPTHRFWEAADIVSDALLPVRTTLDPADPGYVSTHVSRSFLVRATPERLTMAVHVEPIGREILDELVQSGDLDPAVRDAVPTFTLGPTVLEWRSDLPINSGSLACVPEPPPVGTP